MNNPAVHFGISGAGERAWFGWPELPRLEKLITDWARAPDELSRHRIAEEVQRTAFEEVPYVPWGEWAPPSACRSDVRDIVRFGAPLFWNVKIA